MSDTDDFEDLEEDDEVQAAVASLLSETREFLEENASDPEGLRLLGRIEFALEHWFEEEDEEEDDDEDDEHDDNEGAPLGFEVDDEER